MRAAAERSGGPPRSLGAGRIQVGLALLLTAGAAVLAVSLRRLQRRDMGFAADSVTLVKIGLPAGAYDTRDRHLAVFEELARRVAAAPGVRARRR